MTEKLTDKALMDAMLYGVCLSCGTPRELHRSEADGVHTMGIIAPCGHSQPSGLLLDPVMFPPYEEEA